MWYLTPRSSIKPANQIRACDFNKGCHVKSASGGPWTFGLRLKLWIWKLSECWNNPYFKRKVSWADIKVTVSRFSIERLELAEHWTHPWPANTSRWENMNQWSAGGRGEITLITFQNQKCITKLIWTNPILWKLEWDYQWEGGAFETTGALYRTNDEWASTKRRDV